MELITAILGQSKTHTFIAENYIFISWDDDSTTTKQKYNNETSDLQPQEISWLKGTDFSDLTWIRTNDESITKIGNVLFLPLSIEDQVLVCNEVPLRLLHHTKCKHVSISEIVPIVKARHSLLENFNRCFSIYSNFNIYERWCLFKYVQDKKNI